MIRAVIFDMDGVLIDTEPLHYRVWKQVFEEQGLTIDFEHYKGCIGSTAGRLFELMWEHYGRNFSSDPAIPARFRTVKTGIIEAEGLPVMPGAVECVRALKAAGYRLAVASSSPQDYIEDCMKRLGIDDCFERLFSAERVGRPKPAPDVFLETAKHLGVRPGDCIVVEDSHNGSRAAAAAGMCCIGLQNPHSGEQDLSAADWIVTELAPIPELIRGL